MISWIVQYDITYPTLHPLCFGLVRRGSGFALIGICERHSAVLGGARQNAPLWYAGTNIGTGALWWHRADSGWVFSEIHRALWHSDCTVF